MKHQISIIIFLILILANINPCQAQKSVDMIFEIVDTDNKADVEKKELPDSVFIEKAINETLNQLYYKGYLAASIIEKRVTKENVYIKIFKGEIYRLKTLNTGNIEQDVLRIIDFKKFHGGDAFRIQDVENLFMKLLKYSEDNGYPFATVKLDSIKISHNEITARIDWNRGPKIYYDSLVIKGKYKLKDEWLFRYLNVVPGESYDQSNIDLIPSKIENLTFLDLIGSPEIKFYSNEARIEISISEQRINSIDGILGIFPNSREGSKVLLTGNLNLHLYNLFSSGKQLHFDWQKVNVNSQTLDASFYYPQFLTMPLGIRVDFSLLKEDTIYLNRNTTLSLDFRVKSNQRINFTTEFENSGLLTDDQDFLATNNFNEYELVYYGLTYQFANVDDFWFPREGWKVMIDGFVGQKKSNDLADAGEEIKSTQYKIRSEWDFFFDISRSYSVKLGLRSGNLFGSRIFKNDLFRLGGLRSIRGFNENFFFASDYFLGNLEFRIVNSEDTYFLAFYDQAVINDKTDDVRPDFPFGTGLGMRLGTKSGIFNIVLAMGKSRSQIFSLNSAKIHFGYTGRF